MTAERISRRQALRRVGVFGLGLPMASAVLGACSAPAAAPTSAPAAAPTTPPAAAKPTTAAAAAPPPPPTPAPAAAKPTTATAAAPTAATAAQASSKPKVIVGIIQEPTALDPTADATASIATTL